MNIEYSECDKYLYKVHLLLFIWHLKVWIKSKSFYEFELAFIFSLMIFKNSIAVYFKKLNTNLLRMHSPLSI